MGNTIRKSSKSPTCTKWNGQVVWWPATAGSACGDIMHEPPWDAAPLSLLLGLQTLPFFFHNGTCLSTDLLPCTFHSPSDGSSSSTCLDK